MSSSFEIIDFFRVEPNSSRNMRIFKKNSAMNMGKSIFQNLMSSILLRLGKSKQSEHALNPLFSALSALISLAKSALGYESQAPKSTKNKGTEFFKF